MNDDGGAARHRRPTGRRPGDSGTRDAILDAALGLFAELGYDRTSMRAIAAGAEVDPGLIRHFFGDKETLFATTIADRTVVPERLMGALRGDPHTVGLRVADAYLRLWEDPEVRPVLLALVRSASTSERAAEMLREVLGSRAREHVGDLDGAQVRRVGLAAAHLFGIAVTRYVIKLPAVAELDRDALVAEVAPAVQHFLSGE